MSHSGSFVFVIFALSLFSGNTFGCGGGEDKLSLLQQYQKACETIEAEECCPVCQCSADNKYAYLPQGNTGLPDLIKAKCVALEEYESLGGSVDEDIAACEKQIRNGKPCRPDDYNGILLCGGAASPIRGPDKCLFADVLGRCKCN